MKGSIQLLLITILATTATADFDYNSKDVRRILGGINSIGTHKAKIYNSDARVEWELLHHDEDIHFEVKNWKKNVDEKCGGGPTLVIDNGPVHCLSKLIFKVVSVNGKEALKLGLVVQNTKDRNDWKMILSDLFKKPVDKMSTASLAFEQAGDRPGVVPVEPITKEQVARVAFKKSFGGSASWVKSLLEKGIYSFKFKSEEESEKRLYQACPTVMNAETLNEIMDLRLKKFPKEAVKVKTPQNNEIADKSVKQLVDFWNKVEKQ